MLRAILIILAVIVVLALLKVIRPRPKKRKGRRQAMSARTSPPMGRTIPKPTYTSFIGPQSMEDWFDSAADALKRLRKVRGYEVEVIGANGARTTIDVTASDDGHVESVAKALGYECVSYGRFKGVIRGKATRVRDKSELLMLAELAADLLDADRQKHVIKPGEPGSDWEFYMHPTEVDLRPEKVKRADRYGANTYLCVIRFRQESFPIQQSGRRRGTRVAGAGGSINRFDQCMGIAAGLLVLNQGVSADMSR